jgi:hypothetical protein
MYAALADKYSVREFVREKIEGKVNLMWWKSLLCDNIK